MRKWQQAGHARFTFHDIRRLAPKRVAGPELPPGTLDGSGDPQNPSASTDGGPGDSLADDDFGPTPSPITIEQLHEATLLQTSALASYLDAIKQSLGQVTFAGPPGTGKSHLAIHLAQFLCQSTARSLEVVQFHPSYSYEMFVEGVRPITRPGGGIDFVRQDGIVLDVVWRMRAREHIGPSAPPYVIVIDEINRANLPRVLGELMFLMEYRERSVRLPYSREFALPRNLYFLATMNTADRSIRSIDLALRRRFDVFELAPDSSLLMAFLEIHPSTVPNLVEGFEHLNRDLREHIDRHHAIGHTFFMVPNLTPYVLATIWARRVYPLIEEYFFDQPEIAEQFVLSRYWAPPA